MDLQDSLNVAARHMDACCTRTLYAELADGPKPAHVAVDGGVATLVVTVDCPGCGRRNVIRTDGISSIVEKTQTKQGQP